MALVGMDTDLARNQHSQLQSRGIDPIEQAATALTSLLNEIASNWKGNDSTTFHQDWQAGPAHQLQTIIQQLRQFHTNFQRNIEEQEATSS